MNIYIYIYKLLCIGSQITMVVIDYLNKW